MLNMRNTLLFSLAFGLAVTTVEAKVSTVSNPSNLAAATAYSSNRLVQNTVTGTVSDANGPLAGVSVSVVGVPGSTSTDANGQFKITAALGSTLRFSSVGYASKDVKIAGNTINVSLEFEDNSLEEVVVVGYGTQKKEHLTGAISTANMKQVVGDRPIPDLARGLQGAVPGLNVRVPSGEVGSDPLLRVRGQVGSQNGGANPLILVDNVEVPSMQYVNPHDVESVTVLKDAASAAIYGAKAAFGVVLITTKKGTKNETSEVVYSNNFIVQSPFKKIELAGIDGAQYTLDAHENMKQAGAAGGFWRIDRASLERMREWEKLYGDKVDANDPVLYNRDWYWDGTQKFGVRVYDPVAAMVRENAFSHMHNLSLNGRVNTTSYSLGLGYVGQQGMMKAARHDDYMRLNPSLKVSSKVNDFLTVRGGVMYSEGKKRFPTSLNTAGYGADPWLYLYRWSRLFPVGVQENGQDIIDPAFSANASPASEKIDRYINLNLGTTIDLTKNWNIVADYSYSGTNTLNTAAVPYVQAKSTWYGVNARRDEDGNPIFVGADGNITDTEGVRAYEFPVVDHTTKDQTYISRGTLQSKRHTLNAFSTYNLNLATDHELKFMLGTNIVSYEIIGSTAKQGGFLLNDGSNPQFDFATGERSVSGSNAWDSQVGFFGRFNYAFKDKYLFEANLRHDGSSKFPTHLKWRWFPGMSAGWVLSKEGFMENLNPVLSFAKLRGSWGFIGDQSVANNLYIPEMLITQNNWIGASDKYYQLGTPNAVQGIIKWQDIEHLSLGADFRFFNNKLGLSVDWYERNTRNMLTGGITLPPTYGTSGIGLNVSPTGNYGNLRTRGWELAADYTHSFENGLRLTFNANIADAVSIVTKGADWNQPWENRTPVSSQFSTGRTYGDVYGFVTDRLYQKDDFVYDNNGNHVTTTIVRDGVAKTVNVLKGDNPVYQTYFQDGGPVMMIAPGDVKFVDVNGDGFIDVGNGTNGDMGDRVVIGNTTPRYEYGFRMAAEYKGFDISVFFQGVGKRSVWGAGQLAIPGWSAKEGAMPQVIAADYWREDRPDAFYPRAWHLGESNEGYVMRVQSKYMLDMSYLKIKNITLGYNLPENILNRVKMKNARLYVSLENFITFDKLRGLPIDPESISGYSPLRDDSLEKANYNQGRLGTGNPAFKSASMGLQIGF